MAESSDERNGAPAEVPDAVKEWLRSVADERGVSEAELLEALLSGGQVQTGDRDSDRVEQEFRSMIEDVRERVIQVKREADSKAPADHSHHDLRTTMEQLGREVGALDARVEQLDDRLGAGFDNYEEILTYLTETTDELNRRLARLASAVIDIRERVGEAARDEVRRTALSHLTETANRHGIDTAKCEDCGAGVDIGLLVEPQCPHCDTSFSALEPKSGFFRKSVLHTGTVPALESAPEEPAGPDEALEAMVEEAEVADESPDLGPASRTGADEMAPDTGTGTDQATAAPSPGADGEPADAAGTATDLGTAESGSGASDMEEPGGIGAGGAESLGASASSGPGGDEAEAAGEGGDETAAGDEAAAATVDEAGDGAAELQTIDGIGPEYAKRLREAGIDSVLALAVADAKELSETIDVPATTVADWVIQADAYTGT